MEKSITADAAIQQGPADEFIGYHKTMNILEEKWQATEEELAAWIFLGPEQGGIAACIAAYDPPEPFSFFHASTCRNYLPLLYKCCFRRDDIENFKPIDRYITGKVLMQRWGNVRGGPSSFIRARIEESRLLPLHPTFGTIRESFDETASDTNWPTLEEGIFPLKQIKVIEESKEGLFPLAEDALFAHDKSETDTGETPLDGHEEIESFLGWSWNNCKKFMKEKGITGPPDGSKKWILPLDIARIIKEKHPSKRKK